MEVGGEEWGGGGRGMAWESPTYHCMLISHPPSSIPLMKFFLVR